MELWQNMCIVHTIAIARRPNEIMNGRRVHTVATSLKANIEFATV